MDLWEYLFRVNDRSDNPDWEEFNRLGWELAELIKEYFSDLIEIRYKIFDESPGFKTTDWVVVE